MDQDESIQPEQPDQPERDIFLQVFDATRDALSEAPQAFRETMDQAPRAYQQAVDEIRSTLPGFDEVIAQAMRLPGTSVSRAGYLVDAVGHKHPELVAASIEGTPAQAGLSPKQLARIAKKSIGKDGRRTTVLSMAAGIPGGAAAAATIPADLVQFYGHLIRAIQKLTYLYGWRDLAKVEGTEISEATTRALVVMLGVMAGNDCADKMLSELARLRATGADDTALRVWLASSECDASIGEISAALGKRMAHRLGGQVAGKAIPLVGMIVSGTISFAGFGDMCKRLHGQLKRYGG